MLQVNIIKNTKTYKNKLKHPILKSCLTHIKRYIPSSLFKIFHTFKENYFMVNITHIQIFYPTYYPSRNQTMIINSYYLGIVFLKNITN